MRFPLTRVLAATDLVIAALFALLGCLVLYWVWPLMFLPLGIGLSLARTGLRQRRTPAPVPYELARATAVIGLAAAQLGAWWFPGTGPELLPGPSFVSVCAALLLGCGAVQAVGGLHQVMESEARPLVHAITLCGWLAAAACIGADCHDAVRCLQARDLVLQPRLSTPLATGCSADGALVAARDSHSVEVFGPSGTSLRQLPAAGFAFFAVGGRPVCALAARPDRDLAVVEAWDPAAGSRFRLPGDQVAASAEAPYLAVSGSGGLALYHAATGIWQRAFPVYPRDGPRVRLALSPDARLLAAVREDGHLEVWDCESGRLRRDFPDPSGKPPAESALLLLKVDARGLLLEKIEGELRVWDWRDGRLLLRQPSYGADLLPDGATVAYGDVADPAVHLVDAWSGAVRGTLTWSRLDFWSGWGLCTSWLAASPDGTRLAAGDNQGIIRVFDLTTGRREFTLTGHSRPVEALGFSADGRRLVSGAQDRTVRTWKLEL